VNEYSEDLKFWFYIKDLAQVGGLHETEQKSLADIILSTQPELVLETGICAGSSTVIILECLKQLNKGHLYSIDDSSLIKKWTSCFVTEDLKLRWTWIKDKAEAYLPTLANDFKVDIFFHDSCHTYQHMLFEYNWALRHVKSNGWLVSHDCTSNNAWEDFKKNNADKYTDSFSVTTLGGIKLI
jgi:predicted O-methyltransferase YrrM